MVDYKSITNAQLPAENHSPLFTPDWGTEYRILTLSSESYINFEKFIHAHFSERGKVAES
jgi:hypothetical protein